MQPDGHQKGAQVGLIPFPSTHCMRVFLSPFLFNPNTEQENLDIMNKAMNKSNKTSAYTVHISAHQKNPLKNQGIS